MLQNSKKFYIDKNNFFLIVDNINLISENFKTFFKDAPLFLQIKFLEIIERYSEKFFKQHYLIHFKDNVPVDFFLVQESIVELEHYLDQDKLGSIGYFLNKIPPKAHLITLGQNFITGNFGCLSLEFNLNFYSQPEFFRNLKKNLFHKNCISFILIKDLEHELNIVPDSCFIHRAVPVTIEPDMIIDFKENYQNLNEYIQSFSKKYRQRYKRVQDKGKSLSFVSLECEYDFQRYNFYDLFLNVYTKAKWKAFKPQKELFPEMKKAYPKNYFAEIILKDEREAGFLTYFIEGKEMWAHYIGLDYDINREFETYQNILLRFTESGIKHGVEKIHLGRTATEIKSCIGAEPKYYRNYLVPCNLISYWLMKELLPLFTEKPWIKRNPFAN
ncbi:MAG: hypothetical protein N3F09_09045 [Bacteroidia bacterium]|nr:hypothetical protein [Bacteroidia bacterium]